LVGKCKARLRRLSNTAGYFAAASATKQERFHHIDTSKERNATTKGMAFSHKYSIRSLGDDILADDDDSK
jgi:hypothetical protein